MILHLGCCTRVEHRAHLGHYACPSPPPPPFYFFFFPENLQNKRGTLMTYLLFISSFNFKHLHSYLLLTLLNLIFGLYSNIV